MVFELAHSRVALCVSASITALLVGSASTAQELAQSPEEASTAPSPGGVPESALGSLPSGIPTIIVTAQRQAESLQDVPVAVSAFSDEALSAQQIDNGQQLQFSLPNTTLAKSNFGTGANITIRGIGSPAVATSGDVGVAVHFNDRPLIGDGGLFASEFYDLERIEVLRGPQGTLFGRNATGGVVNLITAKPDLSGFGAAGEFEYGNYDAITAKGMVNMPLSDMIGVRLAGIYLNRDGYVDNLFSGGDVDGRDNYSLRGTISFEPTSNTRAYVVGQYTREDSNRSRISKQLCARDETGILGCRPDRLGFDTPNGNATLGSILTSQEFLGIATAMDTNGDGIPDFSLAPYGTGSVYGDSLFSDTNPDDFRQVQADFEPTWFSEGLTIQGEIEHDFGAVTATLNGGYTEGSYSVRSDYNLAVTNSLVPFVQGLQGRAAAGDPIAAGLLSTPLFNGNQICASEPNRDYVGFIGGQVNRCADNTTEFDVSEADGSSWSVEGRVASNFDGPLNFLLGGIYLENHTKVSDYFVVSSLLDYANLLLVGPATGFTAVNGPTFFNSETNNYTLETLGIFGEAYLDITDELKLTGGLRYSKDDKFVSDRQFLANFPIPFGTETITEEYLEAVGYDADVGTPGNQVNREQSASFEEFTGRIVLDWNPVTSFSDSTLLYASYSRGYKPGGINPPFDPALFQAPATFAPEFVNAFEIGTKNVFGGGTFVLNATAFYYDYKDFQVSRIINRTSFNDNTDATIYGLELESIMQPTEGLTLNATMSYQHTKITDLQLADTRDPSGGREDAVMIKDVTSASTCVVTSDTLSQSQLGAIVGAFNAGVGLQAPVAVPGTRALGAFSICDALAATLSSGALDILGGNLVELNSTAAGVPILPGGVEYDLSGNELLNSPNWKFSVGAQYEFELGRSGWTVTPRVDVNMTGDFWATNFNQPVDKLGGYTIVNAQLTVAAPDERFYVRAFVQNAFDELAETGRYVTDQSSGLFTNTFLTDPRLYGAAVGFRF
ncbi:MULTISPECIES: TonB-dependent receptor [Pacificimonas]|uniref:TonB-dependent receptor n=1 Tax=Pacificimonas aurantium TaxID=1250540 RepID=A0ABS7WN44_9SPHN|nr:MULTISPECIES: TonB-dependent receptor [Pacificimonas]MBZ6379828.1 TonB-dependent receptor [Pacificimonas aurantium]